MAAETVSSFSVIALTVASKSMVVRCATPIIEERSSPPLITNRSL